MDQTMTPKANPSSNELEELVRSHANPGEPFLDTLIRLSAEGKLGDDRENWPDWIGSGEGPGDLSINAEKYLGLKPWGPGEEPGGDSRR